MVRADRSIISGDVCLSNIVAALLTREYRRRLFALFDLLPRSLGVRPDLGVHHAVDLFIEVDRSGETGVWAAVVVTMQLFASNAHFLDRELLLDTGAKDIRLVDFEKLLGLVMVDIVDDQRAIFHLRHHAGVIPD